MIFYMFSVIVFALGFALGQKSTRQFHWTVLHQMEKMIKQTKADYLDFLRQQKDLKDLGYKVDEKNI